MNMKQGLKHSREESSRVENLVKDGFDRTRFFLFFIDFIFNTACQCYDTLKLPSHSLSKYLQSHHHCPN